MKFKNEEHRLAYQRLRASMAAKSGAPAAPPPPPPRGVLIVGAVSTEIVPEGPVRARLTQRERQKIAEAGADVGAYVRMRRELAARTRIAT